MIEDVLVKADKFIFPTDFIVLDMEEDKKIPIILGRPFLATGRDMIDVQKGELELRVQDDEVRFSVFNAVRHPVESDACFMIEVVEQLQRYFNRDSIGPPCSKMHTSLCPLVTNAKERGAYQNEMSRLCNPF